jgi:hypothetical protein
MHLLWLGRLRNCPNEETIVRNERLRAVKHRAVTHSSGLEVELRITHPLSAFHR